MLTSTNRRFFSLLAACLLLIVLVFAAQAEPVTARALPAVERQEGDGEIFVYLPLISNVVANNISGRATLDGSPASGYELTLDLHNDTGLWLQTVDATTTDAQGQYQFTNVAEPKPGQHYVVWYLNNTAGNPIDYRCLWFWSSQPIRNSTAYNIDFDIADVFMFEVTGDQWFPITFEWWPRSTTVDLYSFTVFGPDFYPQHQSSILFYEYEYTLTQLPPQFDYGQEYHWGVYVFDEVGGVGLSLVYPITFNQGSKDSVPQILSQFESTVHKSTVELKREKLFLP